jgi:hypothetical protein
MDVAATNMPSGALGSLDAKLVAESLRRAGYTLTASPDGESFDAVIDDTLTITISDWFRAANDLDIPFLLPEDGSTRGHPRAPIPTLRVQALLSDKVGAFNAAAYRDRLVELVSSALPGAQSGCWWHVVATSPQAPVFLQDVLKTVLASIEDAATFVRDGSVAEKERAYAFELPSPWRLAPDADDPDDDAWRHDATNTEARILVAQPTHPLIAFDFHLHQRRIVDTLKTSVFRAVTQADVSIVETVRRLSGPDWFVLQSSNGDLYWAVPQNGDAQAAELLERVLERRGIEVFQVRDEDRDQIIQSIDHNPTIGGMIVTGGQAQTTPVRLDQRTFWLSRHLVLATKVDATVALDLLKYKATYESRHGFDMLGDRTEATFASEELRQLLFDPLSPRGPRMLDIAVANGAVSVYLRIRDGNIAAAGDLVPQYLTELDAVCADVMSRLGAQPLAAATGPTERGSAEPEVKH